jgi:HTH-type transcriptional regulator, sugar sensing transcriptional regulator
LKDLIQKIEKLGFKAYEAKVFLVLYQGYKMSAAEIAKEAKIPRTSVYDILKSFTVKGICNEVHTPSKLIYEVIDSKVLEDKIKIEIEQEHKRKLIAYEDCFTALKPVYKSKQPAEYKADVELIKGYNRLRDQKFLEMVKKSNKAIMIMNSLRGSNISLELDDESKKFHKRGGAVRSIYQSKGDFKIKINNKWQNVTKEGLIKLCEAFATQGEDVRFLEEVPQFMAIFDEKIVYFSLYDENIPIKDMSDIFIYNQRFAKFVKGLFDMYWDKANTIDLLKEELNTSKSNQ